MNTIKFEVTPHEADLVVLGLDSLQIRSAELAIKIRDQAMPQAMPQLEISSEVEAE